MTILQHDILACVFILLARVKTVCKKVACWAYMAVYITVICSPSLHPLLSNTSDDRGRPLPPTKCPRMSLELSGEEGRKYSPWGVPMSRCVHCLLCTDLCKLLFRRWCSCNLNFVSRKNYISESKMSSAIYSFCCKLCQLGREKM